MTSLGEGQPGSSASSGRAGVGGAQGTRGRLAWVEVGRGLAALAVVCAHMPPISRLAWSNTIGLGAMGVEFFFLLSGFIMLHIHMADLGRPGALGRFAWRRAGRIFPIYWLVLILMLIVDAALVSAPYRAHIDAAFLARQVLMLPGEALFIGPAWTLRHELFFYSVFALLILDRRVGLAALALWLAGILVSLPLIGPGMAPTNLLREVVFHHYNLDFALGMGLAVALRRGLLRGALIGSIAAAAVTCAAWAATGLAAGGWLQVFAYKALFCAALAGAVHVSTQGRRAPAALLLLGAASYSIYLINRSAGFNLERIARRLSLEERLGEWPMFVLFVAAAVAAGLLLHLVAERPILRWVAARTPRTRDAPPAGG